MELAGMKNKFMIFFSVQKETQIQEFFIKVEKFDYIISVNTRREKTEDKQYYDILKFVFLNNTPSCMGIHLSQFL